MKMTYHTHLACIVLALFLLMSSCCIAVPENLSISINAGAAYTPSAAVSLSLYADSAENCTLSNDGSSWSAEFAYTTSSGWNLTAADSTKTVHFKCIGADGNWSNAAADSIILDTAVPGISSNSPTGNITNRMPVLSAFITDSSSGIALSSLHIYLDGNEKTGFEFNNATGNISYTVSSNLSLSFHNVTIAAGDQAGNNRSFSWLFEVSSPSSPDNQTNSTNSSSNSTNASTTGVGFSSYSPAKDSITKNNKPQISIIFVDLGNGVNGSTRTMSIDSGDVSNATSYSNNSKMMSYSPSNALNDGEHTVSVSVRDNSGNVNSTSWPFSVDATPPRIGFLVPANGSNVTVVYEISAIVEDTLSGLDRSLIFMSFDGADISSRISFANSSNKIVFVPETALGGGTHTVELWARDKVGNEVRLKWFFAMPTSAPVFSSRTPAPDSTIGDPKPEISVVIADSGSSGLNINSLKMYIDNLPVAAVLIPSTGKFSYIPSANLSEGKHNIRVVANNNKGESGESSWSFTLDLSAPQQPANFNASKTSDGVQLTWKASASPDVSKYKIYASSTEFTYVASGLPPIAEVASPKTGYFHNTTEKFFYALVAYDKLGNPSSPVFTSPCALFEGGAWIVYRCCADSDCSTGYTCNQTSHFCTELSNYTSSSDVNSTMRIAAMAISDAKKLGKNVTEAEKFMQDAQNSFAAGNYEDAGHFAHLAMESALGAPTLENATAENIKTDKGKACPLLSAILLLASAAVLSSTLLSRQT